MARPSKITTLLEIEDEIDAASDLLRCLDMALMDIELASRSPLETVLGIALRQMEAASAAVYQLRSREGA